jgi:hypothetical protein
MVSTINMHKWEECYLADKQKPEAITADNPLPMLKTVEQMSRISGLGENKLRELMDQGELEYIQNGNRRLLVDHAIWDWYQRNKISVRCPVG